MEGLSVLIKKAKEDGDLHGLHINEIMYLIHLLFFDDVLIFLDGSGQDSIQFEKILQIFCRPTGMIPNSNKSTIIMTRCSIREQGITSALFDYVPNNIEVGLKYLGFHLKPNDY